MSNSRLFSFSEDEEDHNNSKSIVLHIINEENGDFPIELTNGTFSSSGPFLTLFSLAKFFVDLVSCQIKCKKKIKILNKFQNQVGNFQSSPKPFYFQLTFEKVSIFSGGRPCMTMSPLQEPSP